MILNIFIYLHPNRNVYSTKTPDGVNIEFERLFIPEGKALLEDGTFQILPDEKLDFYKKDAYLLIDNRVLYEVQEGGYYYLLKSETEYAKMIRGERYWAANIMVDKDNKVYSSFNLNPTDGYDFFQKKIKHLEKYPVFDGYRAYLLPDNSIAYLRHRIHKLYDGYWYPSIKDFEHEYYFLTADSYSPPRSANKKRNI